MGKQDERLARVTELVDAAAEAVAAGIADAMFAARHATTKDGKPTGNAAAWRAFCDEPTLRLWRAMAGVDPEQETLLVNDAARRYGRGEAQDLTVAPALGRA